MNRDPLRRPTLGLLVVAGIWMIVLPGAPLRSLGGAIALTSIVVVSALVARRDRRALLLVLAAAAMLPWLAIRHSPWLHTPNLIMACVLFLSAGALQPGESLSVTLRSWLHRWGCSTATMIRGPELVGADIAQRVPDLDVQRRRIRQHGASVVAAFGLSLIVVVLLASGDALFASYLDVGWLLSDAALRSMFGLIGGALLLAGMGVQRTVETSEVRPRAPRPEAVTMTMLALTVVIGGYGVVQLLGALRGADYVATRTGLTYADYARSGFFQTVAVVAITVATLAVARSATLVAPPSMALRRSSMLLTVGTLCLVVSSVVKLVIYTDRFGLTMLRLYTMIFAVWLGGVARPDLCSRGSG